MRFIFLLFTTCYALELVYPPEIPISEFHYDKDEKYNKNGILVPPTKQIFLKSVYPGIYYQNGKSIDVVYTQHLYMRPMPHELGAHGGRKKGFDSELRTFVSIGEHPNIVKFVGHNNDERIIILEKSKYGSIAQAILNKEIDLTFGHQVVVLQQMCQGLQAFYDADIVWRDLHLGNVLLFRFNQTSPLDTIIKLVDFDDTIIRSECYKDWGIVGGELFCGDEGYDLALASAQLSTGASRWKLDEDGLERLDPDLIKFKPPNVVRGHGAFIIEWRGRNILPSPPQSYADEFWEIFNPFFIEHDYEWPITQELCTEIKTLYNKMF